MAEKKEVSADKLKVLNAVLDKIEKDFGKGAVMRMSSVKPIIKRLYFSLIISAYP